ncbi:Fe(2+) transporter permease subunit FeoB [Psychromonas sp. 14N.309.X.WAT.B.A12]|uniref:Fe(2+) transporter permease subunit FeoB n=1 Tax=Psychromonas sp. 14N.309.X.WAT.B.A12 TaxID=2998322 RepID=UPI0025B245EB|nr:Fe(2+) transporter permease subunit FeoB [Psychromonas sp. 14N.309.X.WAT.B.A12]MDN2663647.1 Fe(2+) transporter permease subunit FeoB [Psychromonas sp. 14N.309.X.WAT.B.A12]
MSMNIATIGNPNSGKTTLFNALTGSHQRVGNWSGVTVEKKTGHFNINDKAIKVIDLPGIYNLDIDQQGSSMDERVAFDYIMHSQPDMVLNIIDASCLERSLYLTVQLLELGLPVMVVLNKIDVADKQQKVINDKLLSEQLGCPVIAISAHNQQAVTKLTTIIEKLDPAALIPDLSLDYGDQLEAVLSKIEYYFDTERYLHKKAFAIKCVEGDASVIEQLPIQTRLKVQHISSQISFDIDLQIADTRYTYIYQLTQLAVRTKGCLSKSLTDKIDAVALNRYTGLPVFLLVMYLMFMFAINVGSAFIDFFDIASGALFVDQTAQWLTAVSAPDWLINVLAYGVGGGIQTVMTFIPVIACLYLFLAVLESSGYLARAAFVIDRLMQLIGLPGKSFVPMIVGFGCTVPAVMAARTLEKERERLLTVVMSPFMSCGARLPVYALFASAFFPNQGQNIVFLLYLIGILVAVLTGFILSRTILPGKSENMILEIPDYELPTIKNTGIKTWQKLKGFVFGAGQTIVLVVTLLNVVNSIGMDGSFGHQDTEGSVLSKIAQTITPVLSPLGINEQNWPATVGIVTGIFAKEAVVGTLNSLYDNEVREEEEALSLLEKLSIAVATIPENLMGIDISDPLGINVGELEDLTLAAEEQGVDLTIYTNIQQAFVSQQAAFAYLLFILLYAPCAAAMGAIVREVGMNWARFVAIWSTGIAYIVAVVYYQIATIAAHPILSFTYLSSAILIIVGAIYALRNKGNLLLKCSSREQQKWVRA